MEAKPRLRIEYIIYPGIIPLDPEDREGYIEQDKFHGFREFKRIADAQRVYRDIVKSNIERLKKMNSGAYLYLALYSRNNLITSRKFNIVEGRIH